ncbi:L-threonylcarbamoyladenylate synthase [Paenibacillus sp. GCM10012307]|uniref:L-threonylcarbamoyladenylate synthase n=1 Tax=Paenibacillus TaxID=44249 RepID=UPI002FCE2634
MNTRVWHLQQDEESNRQDIEEAAACLKEGKTVAFPTETVYGLGADARNTDAVAKIFTAKGRPSDNPLIVHIASTTQLLQLVKPWGELADRLMKRFWPGALTIVLPVKEGAVSALVTAGLDTLGVRMPQHRTALRLIESSGCPVAAPSANRSGRPSPTLAAHVAEDLSGSIDGLVDDGPAGVGLESTVIEIVEGLSGEAIRILRPGGVTREELQKLGHILEESDPAGSIGPEAAPRSPGMKYRHYAPRGSVRVVDGEPKHVQAHIRRELAAASIRGERTGVLAFEEHAGRYEADLVLSCGSLSDIRSAAHGLYAALREFDTQGIELIWAEACRAEGIGAAYMNRLIKAASNQLQHV